ncbi:flagellar basal-body rod protein FlgB [Desulforamulus reducens MI-1]|uniref:Flagellar basal body rod protein FlgB n=1 Tax=Desulforamulus reducens (strain ATCC BAA-1160 / DSM 100696 / MI-1) TaxID=349161 RepID=A4J768_DESRM|nr:flagellar basal body rod protein FlgB [Desulforamulus reducens]ABO50921.1 flagellar basal-body rod protein FlgB [Desulforamulus reducens MI-1]
MDVFNSPTLMILQQGLDAGAARQRVIANNIANFNTPGFKKSYVSFEDQLKAALGNSGVSLKGTHPLHIGTSNREIKPEIKQVEETTMRYDGNNVDVDEEMVNLAAATIEYDVLAQGVMDRFHILGTVIGGRR